MRGTNHIVRATHHCKPYDDGVTGTTNKPSPSGEWPDLADQLEIAAALVRLSHIVQAAYGEIAASHNLTLTQAKLLCILKDSPRGMTELAQLLHLEKSSVSGLVDRIHQRQLIERQPSPADRRAVTIRLSAKGHKVATAFYVEGSCRLAKLVEHLSPRDRRRFSQLTTQIIEQSK